MSQRVPFILSFTNATLDCVYEKTVVILNIFIEHNSRFVVIMDDVYDLKILRQHLCGNENKS